MMGKIVMGFRRMRFVVQVIRFGEIKIILKNFVRECAGSM
jgi:hypothetical protein